MPSALHVRVSGAVNTKSWNAERAFNAHSDTIARAARDLGDACPRIRPPKLRHAPSAALNISRTDVRTYDVMPI